MTKNQHGLPRPAATVVAIRESATGAKPELFMLRRHSRAVFGSHFVFPGGVLETMDAKAHRHARGVSADDAREKIGIQEGALDYYSAAIRETFEESAILFAKDREGRWAFTDAADSDALLERFRTALNAGRITWPDFLQTNELSAAYDALHYIAYWVTPRVQSKRFTTRFFLAVVPEGQQAAHDNGELTDSCWLTADDALARGKRGEMKLMYPTFSTLRDIAKRDSVEDIVQWAKQRSTSGAARLLPAFVEVNGRDEVVMPDSPHYPSEFDL